MNTAPHKATVGMNANTWALLIYLISIGLGWISGVYYFAWAFPLVIFITEKVSGFVRFHAMQAVAILILNAITALISDIIYVANAPADMLGAFMEGFFGVGGGPNPGDVIWIITTIVWDIFLVMGAVQASRYDAKPLPLFGAFAKALAGIGNKNPGVSPFEPDPVKQQQYWQAQQYKAQQQAQGYTNGQYPPQPPQAPPVQANGQQAPPYAQQQQPQVQPNMQPPYQASPQGQPNVQQQTPPPHPQVPYQQTYQQGQAPQAGQMQGQPMPQQYQQAAPQDIQPPYQKQAQPAAGAPQEWYRSAPQQQYQPQQPQQQFQGKQSGYFTVGERKVHVDRPDYTGEQIMDRLLGYAQLPGQPYFKKMWGRNYVVIPGAGTKDMMINHTGMPGQFILSEIDRPGTLGKSVLMAGLTSGMADVVESSTSNLNQLMDQVANELFRLFGKR